MAVRMSAFFREVWQRGNRRGEMNGRASIMTDSAIYSVNDGAIDGAITGATTGATTGAIHRTPVSRDLPVISTARENGR